MTKKRITALVMISLLLVLGSVFTANAKSNEDTLKQVTVYDENGNAVYSAESFKDKNVLINEAMDFISDSVVGPDCGHIEGITLYCNPYKEYTVAVHELVAANVCEVTLKRFEVCQICGDRRDYEDEYVMHMPGNNDDPRLGKCPF